MARKAASGHPKPLEELTVTIAPSLINSAIFSIGMIFGPRHNYWGEFRDRKLQELQEGKKLLLGLGSSAA